VAACEPRCAGWRVQLLMMTERPAGAWAGWISLTTGGRDGGSFGSDCGGVRATP
jgi:hypothetical protein